MNILSIVWNADPIIFSIGPVQLRWYSLMFIISFALGLVMFRKMVVREAKPIRLYDNILYYVFFGTLLGARLGHCLFYDPGYYLANPIEIFWPFQNGEFVGYQGLASHGAAVGILIAMYFYAKKNNVPYLWGMDKLVICVALAAFFIRMGNLINSEVYGHETSLPWGFIFVRNHETVPKHPTQLYEALAYLITFITIAGIYVKKNPPFKDGVIFGVFLIMIFGSRFFIEFIKEVQVEFEESMTLVMGQWLSIPLVIAGVVLIFMAGRGGSFTKEECYPKKGDKKAK